ncbi:MAG TPA: CBS domain-containing protein [Mycobacteriales bacterium]
MTTPTKPSTVRVFAARLAGLAVFDPNGDQVGRARDVAAALRPGGQPPRVIGLVIEVQRRPIFVPMGRVASLDAGQVVLSSGTVSLQRYEQRPGESLVLGELLDRKVTVRETGATVTVVDVAMEETRLHDWLLTKVAVREGRRRGALQTYDWDEVDGFALPEAEQGAANLLAALEKMRPADLATVLHDLSHKRRAEVAAALDDEMLADVLEELPDDDQVEILGSLATDRAADVLEAMDPDDAADLLGELPTAEQERLLELMEPADAEPVRRLLTYEEDTAGGIMTTEPVILAPNATVAEALAHVRNPDLTPALAAMVYVVRPPFDTPTGKLLGTVHFQRLLREPPGTLVAGLVDETVEPLDVDATLRQITGHFATYNLVAAPVVDEAGRLLGAVSVDDVLDHMLPDDWRERDEVDPHG